MVLRSIFQNANTPCISFEFFPPKTPKGEANLFRHLERLLAYRPAFITCTYGAGGSTRDKTLHVVRRFKQTAGVPVASHLTCVGASRSELRAYLQRAMDLGVDAIVALRGDPPRDAERFEPAPDGLAHANELVALIRREFPRFGIAVAGYPEKHVEAPSMAEDLKYLKQKIEAGADVVITQLFYDNDHFFAFRDRCQAMGIGVPIVPGILPISSLDQIRRLTALCGATLPASLVARLEAADNPSEQAAIGTEHAIGQVRQLVAAGVPGIHFYVLNRSEAASQILDVVPFSTPAPSASPSTPPPPPGDDR